MSRRDAWAIVVVRDDSILHTNWMLGVGEEAWDGMWTGALFDTRASARRALSFIKARGTAKPHAPNGRGLPMQVKIRRVRVVTA